MTSFIRSFLTFLALFASSQVFAAPDEKLDYFVFLVTGSSTEGGTAKEDIEKMQTSHLENFGRLAKIGET